MHEFDTISKEKLRRLTQERAVLHFPFFANTFSLAYHYRSLLGEKASSLIVEQDWKKPVPNLSSKNLHVFYGTEKAIKDRCEKDTKYAIVSRYRPRVIFAEYHPFLYAEVSAERKGERVDLDRDDSPQRDAVGEEERRKRQVFPETLTKIAKDLNVETFELFTDVPDQARLIQERMKPQHSKIVAEGGDGLESPPAGKRCLRLYFYGAPASTRMLRDPFKYIPFLIEDGLLDSDPTMLTCIGVVDKRNIPKRGECLPEILDILKDYHQAIFDAARRLTKEPAMEFREVFCAYNRLAERKQHSTVFETPAEFAACLRTHHKAPDGN